MIGKRKRVTRTEDASPQVTAQDAQEIFRRHFEAQFAPLEHVSLTPEEQDLDTSDSSANPEDGTENGAESDWSGVSSTSDYNDDDEDDLPAIIDHSTPTTSTPPSTMTKKEQRAFLSSRPPSTTTSTPTVVTALKTLTTTIPSPNEPEDSSTLLKNDLALQRLISESHILSSSTAFPSSSSSSTATFSTGRTRLSQTDSRLRSLGASRAVHSAQPLKMAMAMRQGIDAARTQKEGKRRREARENGIILERVGATGAGGGKKSGSGAGRRKGGGGGGRYTPTVDAPGLGKMKGGELRLNKRAVEQIGVEVKRRKSMSFGRERRKKGR